MLKWFIKMSIFHTLIYRFHTTPTKILADLFADTEVDPKIPMDTQGTQNGQNNLGKEEELEDSHF
jgi:hypothetical protein